MRTVTVGDSEWRIFATAVVTDGWRDPEERWFVECRPAEVTSDSAIGSIEVTDEQ